MGTKLESKLAITLDRSNPVITQIRLVLVMEKAAKSDQLNIWDIEHGFPVFGDKQIH